MYTHLDTELERSYWNLVISFFSQFIVYGELNLFVLGMAGGFNIGII
jgi:hypothetical protein